MKKIYILVLLSVFLGSYSHSQCTISATSNISTASCGDCVDLQATAVSQPPLLNENFNNGTLGPDWSSNVALMYNNPCTSPPDGTAAGWFGNQSFPRSLESVNFDVSCGGEICFEMRYSIQGDASPCEGPDLTTEGCHVQFSTNNGATWTDIAYYDPTTGGSGGNPSFTNWNNFCLVIPPAAIGTSTKFRWYQNLASGNGNDHWGLDNISITANDCGYHYDWLVDGTSNSQDTTICPSANTTYTVIYTNGIDDTCTASVPITVLNPDIDPYTDQIVCDNYTLPTITGTGLTGGQGYYSGPGGTGTQYQPGDVIAANTTIYAYDGTTACNDEESFDVIVTNNIISIDTINYNQESCSNASDGSVDAEFDVFQVSGATITIDDITWTSPSGVVSSDNGGTGQTTYTSSMAGMESGTWTITVVLDNGCDLTENIVIESAVPFDVSLTNVVELDCAFEDSAAIDITVTGGALPYDFQWDDPGNTTTEDIDELGPGTYNVIVTDDNGCTDNIQVVIDNPSPIVITSAPDCDGTVAGNGIVFTVSGGAPQDQGSGSFSVFNQGDGIISGNVVLNNGNITVSNLNNNESAIIKVTDSKGCSDSITAVFSSPVINNIIIDNATNCGGAAANDGQVDVTIVSGTVPPYEISMNGNVTTGTSASLTNQAAGTNVVILVTDNENCAADSSVTIGSDGVSIDFNLNTNNDVSCFGGNDGEFIIDISVIDPGSNGFTIASTEVVSPTGFIGNDNTGNGLTSHTLNIDTASSGNWLVTVTLSNGCVFTQNVVVDQPNPINVTAVSSQVKCHDGNDGSVDVTVTGGVPGYSYSWSGLTTTDEDLDQLTAGNYELTITDNSGCQTVRNFEFPNPPELTADILTAAPTCNGYEDGQAGVTNVQGNQGALTYVWSTDNPNGNINPVSNLLPGTHTVQIFDQNGCDLIMEFVVDETPPFIVNNLDSEPSKCRSNGLYPGTGQVTANIGGSNGGVSIVWYGNGETTNTPTWGNRTPGTYTFIATDSKGCEYTDQVVVDSINPEASFTATPLLGNAPLFVDVTNTSTGIDQNNASYTWDAGFGSFYSTEIYSYAPDTTYTEGGDYVITLIVTNEYGCKDTAIQDIEVYTPLDYEEPNVFTPNGDGSNDVFYVPGEGISPEGFEMTVFNRWGEKLYFTEVPGAVGGWDGTNKKGKDVPEGVYQYMFKLKAEDGTDVEGQGFVHLLRAKN